MEYIIEGASLECLHAEVVSRDIKLSALVDVPEIGKCRKYNCKRNSKASILEELNPKKPIINLNSRLNIGDSIKAEEIVILLNNLRTLKIEVINLSGRHKAQKTETNCYTHAEITMQFPQIGEIKDENQFLALTPYLLATGSKEQST
jgi:hypothetical protein